MKDYEILCAFISVMKHIGQVEELNLNKAGGISVEGSLPDGREVHLFVMPSTKEDV